MNNNNYKKKQKNTKNRGEQTKEERVQLREERSKMKNFDEEEWQQNIENINNYEKIKEKLEEVLKRIEEAEKKLMVTELETNDKVNVCIESTQ